MYLVENLNTSASPRVICGRGLLHRKLDARQRAAIAVQLLVGEAAIEMSSAQLARLLGVSVPYIRAARQLSSSKRQAIADGKDRTPFAILIKPTLPAPRVADDQIEGLRHIA
jgi:hypothetical protein